MFALWTVLRTAIGRVHPRTPPLPGTPVRAIIAPTACGGYVLAMDFITTSGERRFVRDLPTRMEPYGPTADAAEVAEAVRRLHTLGLIPTDVWTPNHRGYLCAPITAADSVTPEVRR